MTFRKQVERVSAPLLVRLTRMPKFVLPVALIVLLFSGFYNNGVLGGLFLAVVDVFIGWLIYLSWPVDTGKKRVIRVLILLVLILLTTSQFSK